MTGVKERLAISRASTKGLQFTLTNSLATTAIIEKNNYAGFGFITAEQVTGLTYYVSYDKENFSKLRVDNEVDLTDQKAFCSPPEVWPFPFVKVVTNITTVATVGLIG